MINNLSNQHLRYGWLSIAVLVTLMVCLWSLSLDDQGLNLGWLTGDDELQYALAMQLRLPRLLTALLVGGGLALAGAILQVVFANPVAEPGLIGISSSASFAAVCALFLTSLFGIDIGHWQLASVCAFAGALLSSWILSRADRWLMVINNERLILLGVATATMTNAMTAWLLYFSDDGQLRNIQFWLLGYLGAADAWQLLCSAIVMLLAALWVMRNSHGFNMLLSGEDNAQLMGLNTSAFRRKAILSVAVLSGLAVALAGVVGFVGLLVPHLLRLVWGDDQRLLLPLSAITGAMLLALMDICSRHLLDTVMLPIGIVTASLGAPVFIILLLKGRF